VASQATKKVFLLAMYRDICERYRKELQDFPRLRRPLIGAVIKETRVDKGIRQIDFAKKVGLNLSTLKSIENDHQQATTVENLAKFAKELDLPAEEIILLGCERDPANYFVYKRTGPPAIKGIRKRKRFPEEWRASLRLRFKDFDITPISPPITTRKDFFLGRLVLPPKRVVEKLCVGVHNPVIGFIASGYNVHIRYAGQSATLTGNQGFSLDGAFRHEIANEDGDNTAVIYLLTKFPNFEKVRPINPPQIDPGDDLNIAQGIDQIRKHKSDRVDKPLAVTHLADLTDSLNHEQIIKLMRIKKTSSVIYWEKIEDLLAATGVSMDEFLLWCRRQEKNSFSMATIGTRALIDYSAYHGVKIYSCVPPDSRNEFFCGEILIESQTARAGNNWKRKDNSMIALYVEEGEIEITVGKRRSPLTLLKGESVYFDGSLGYSLRNPGQIQAKGFFASSPGIVF